MKIPVAWVLAIIGTLATATGTLAGIAWSSANDRIAALEEIAEECQRDRKALHLKIESILEGKHR